MLDCVSIDGGRTGTIRWLLTCAEGHERDFPGEPKMSAILSRHWPEAVLVARAARSLIVDLPNTLDPAARAVALKRLGELIPAEA